MAFKVLLAAAASALAVSPAFALTNSEIVHHSGGPIPYSELVSSGPSSSGYQARGGRRHRKSTASESSAATSTPSEATTGAAPSPGSEAAPAPSPDANAPPAAAPAPAPDAGAAPSPGPAPSTSPSP
jgi:hypothetical protein